MSGASSGLALAVTAAIVGVSFALDPALWRQWVDVISASSSTPTTVGWYLPVSLLVRLPIAIVDRGCRRASPAAPGCCRSP